MIEIKLDREKVDKALEHLSNSVSDMSPVMKNIAGIFDHAVHENFARQGRPQWMGLSPTTQKLRAKKGHWPGSILQQTGGLLGSIGIEFGSDYARVGVLKGKGATKYAAMQQFGGVTSSRSMIPNKKIVARPFLSITDADEDKILTSVNDYLRGVIG